MRKITQLRSRLFCNHHTMQMQHSSWHFNTEISSIRLEKPQTEAFKKHPKASLMQNKKLLCPQENATNNHKSEAAMLPSWQPESNGGNMANFPGVCGRRLEQSISDSFDRSRPQTTVRSGCSFFHCYNKIRIMTRTVFKCNAVLFHRNFNAFRGSFGRH